MRNSTASMSCTPWSFSHLPHIARLSARMGDVAHERLATAQPFGIFHCYKTQNIRRVPIFQPMLIAVLVGEKRLYRVDDAVVCRAGHWLALPAPHQFDLVNQPDPIQRRYLALAVPIGRAQLARFMDRYASVLSDDPRETSLCLAPDIAAWEALDRVAEIASMPDADPVLFEHRFQELLLVLLRRYGARHLLSPVERSWRERVAHLFSADPAFSWDAASVASRFDISPATLRRHLQKETCRFSGLLEQVRMQRALSLLQQNGLPIGNVAAACGYRSASRFSEAFRRQFGLLPSELRASQEKV